MAELTDQELDQIEDSWRHVDADHGGCFKDVARLVAEVRRQREGPKERVGKWGTGSDRGDRPGPRMKTLYGPDGELRGMMSTTEDALLVVKALDLMERAERVEAAVRTALDKFIPDGYIVCRGCGRMGFHEPACPVPGLEAALAAAPAPGRAVESCPAAIRCGPGHQSRARCDAVGSHEQHHARDPLDVRDRAPAPVPAKELVSADVRKGRYEAVTPALPNPPPVRPRAGSIVWELRHRRTLFESAMVSGYASENPPADSDAGLEFATPPDDGDLVVWLLEHLDEIEAALVIAEACRKIVRKTELT